MKVNVPLPVGEGSGPEDFGSLQALSSMAASLERGGFHAGLVTDHPCPTGEWLDAGGHSADGPFVTLALLAACTTRLRLQTSVLVLPLRNPFAVARELATLDRYSGGRVTLGVGAGYLEGEYLALGAEFSRRNEALDEYIRALRAALSGEDFAFEGTGYRASGNRIEPGPVQDPLPIYAGGNTRRAIRRAAELCEGWNPFLTGNSGYATRATRTAAMRGHEDVRAGIDYLREQCGRSGRTTVPEVDLGGVTAPGEAISGQELLDRLCSYRELGVSAASINVPGDTPAEWCDNVERIGEEVIAGLRD